MRGPGRQPGMPCSTDLRHGLAELPPRQGQPDVTVPGAALPPPFSQRASVLGLQRVCVIFSRSPSSGCWTSTSVTLPGPQTSKH